MQVFLSSFIFKRIYRYSFLFLFLKNAGLFIFHLQSVCNQFAISLQSVSNQPTKKAPWAGLALLGCLCFFIGSLVYPVNIIICAVVCYFVFFAIIKTNKMPTTIGTYCLADKLLHPLPCFHKDYQCLVAPLARITP